METSKNTGRKWTTRAQDVLKMVILLTCAFDVGCAQEAAALLTAMLGAQGGQAPQAPGSSSALRPGSASSPTGSNFDPLAASRSQPRPQIVANGPTRQNIGGFNPISDTQPRERHPFGGGDLIAQAPEFDGGGGGRNLPLGGAENFGGGERQGSADFVTGM